MALVGQGFGFLGGKRPNNEEANYIYKIYIYSDCVIDDRIN